MKLIVFLLLIQLGLSGAVEDDRYSAHCQKCIEPCTLEPGTETYRCKTDEWFKEGADNVTDWDFCSLSGKIDHKGRNCTNDCDFHDKGYQWCIGAKFTWGFCSGESCKPDYGYSAQCQKCIGPCVKEPETKEYRCTTDYWYNKLYKDFEDWDWCSPSEKQNHHGNNCTNQCDFYGKDYHWCTDEYQWGYCSDESCVSQQREQKDHGYSAHCKKCIEPCKKEPETKSYKCKTYKWFNKEENNVTDWDWCSLSDKLNHKEDNCTNECAFYGEDYQWCTGDQFSWGYCSGNFCTSAQPELKDHGYSSYCQRCIDSCQKLDFNDEHWCRTLKYTLNNDTRSYDRCSPDSSVDYKGRLCKNKCGFNEDQNYQWCEVDVPDDDEDKEGYVGYCSGKGNVICDFVGDL